MTWFLNEYVEDDYSYEDILTLYQPIDEEGNPDETFRNYLKDIKRGRVYILEEAREVAAHWLQCAEKALTNAKEMYSGEEDGLVSARMDEILGDMIKRAVRNELQKENE